MDTEAIKKELDIILNASVTEVTKTLGSENEATREKLEQAINFQNTEDSSTRYHFRGFKRTKSATSLKAMTHQFTKELKIPKPSRAESENRRDDLYQYPNRDSEALMKELKDKLNKITRISNESKMKLSSKASRTCGCMMKQLNARKAGKHLLYKPKKQPEKDNDAPAASKNSPVAFGILPEKDVTKPADPAKKFFFGCDGSCGLNPELSPPKQLNDPSQSVMVIIDNVHDTAEKLLFDTEKVLEKLDLIPGPYEVNREEVHLPMMTKLKEVAFGFAPEEELRELEKQAKRLKEDPPVPMLEVEEDPLEEINKKLFESTLKPEFFSPPKLAKVTDNMVFKFSEKTGAMKYEKRLSGEDKLDEKTPTDIQVEEEPPKIQTASKASIRRVEAADDLSNVGKKTKKVCGCEGLHSIMQKPVTCVSIDGSTARFVDEQLKAFDQKKAKEKAREIPVLKEEDDDGFAKIPNFPSSVIREVSSSEWIDDSITFYVSETPSVHMESHLEKAIEIINPPTTDSIESTQSASSKKKESKLRKVKSGFSKWLPNIFRSKKE